MDCPKYSTKWSMSLVSETAMAALIPIDRSPHPSPLCFVYTSVLTVFPMTGNIQVLVNLSSDDGSLA